MVSGFFQPTNGGKETHAENIHTNAIMNIAREGVRFFKYCTACVTDLFAASIVTYIDN